MQQKWVYVPIPGVRDLLFCCLLVIVLYKLFIVQYKMLVFRSATVPVNVSSQFLLANQAHICQLQTH